MYIIGRNKEVLNKCSVSYFRSCWLTRCPFYGAFVGPAFLIVLIDLIIFLRVYNLINRTYDIEATSQPGQENEVEIAAEENALIIKQEPLPDFDETGDILGKSALPDENRSITCEEVVLFYF